MNRILDNELLSNQGEDQYHEEVKNGEGKDVFRTVTPKCEIDIDDDPRSVTPQSMQKTKRLIVPLDFNIHEDFS
jgi:hypothetical protein